MNEGASRLAREVENWVGRQNELTNGSEDVRQMLERFEVVDPAGLVAAGHRLAAGTILMMEQNGIERGAMLNNVMMLLLGAHLGRRGVL